MREDGLQKLLLSLKIV